MGVIIINQGWTDNLGDVAIGKTLKKELKDFHPLELQFAPIMAKPAQTTASKILELIKLDCRYVISGRMHGICICRTYICKSSH